jgi:hypothetical protein
MAHVPLEDAVKEVSFFIENGGVCARNAEHIVQIIEHHGKDSHEVFQEASEQVTALIAAGIVDSTIYSN